MIDGNVNEFVDNLHYGSEMYFIFRNKKYFIQGWYKEPFHYLVLDEIDDNDNSDNYQFTGYLWEHQSIDAGECVESFINAPLWDNKTFYEVEQEMIWTEP